MDFKQSIESQKRRDAELEAERNRNETIKKHGRYEYPLRAALLGIKGCVDYSITIDDSGKTSEVEVHSGPRTFRKPTIEGALTTVWHPKMENGEPVKIRKRGCHCWGNSINYEKYPVHCQLGFVDNASP